MAEDLSALASLVYRRARSVETTFARFRAREFASRHFEALAKFPQDTAREIRKAVPRRLAQSTKPGVKTSHVARILRRYGQALGFVHESLGFVLNAEVLSIPAPFVLVLEDIASKFVRAHFVLQGAPEFNYSFLSIAPNLNSPLEYAGLKPRLPDEFAVFRFPAASHEEALEHCILAHEVGHYIDSTELLWRRAWLDAPESTRSRIERFIGTQMGTVPGGVESEALKEYLGTFVGWITETVCDVAGSRLIGPAYLFSAAEFLRLTSELTSGTSTHPPPSARLTITSEELKSMGWKPDLDGHLIGLDIVPPRRWKVAQIKAMNPVDRPLPILERCLWELLPSIRRVVRSRIADESYTRKKYAPFSATIVDLLSQLVPPGEQYVPGGHGDAIDPRAILNGAWLFHLEGYPGWPELKGQELHRKSEKWKLMSRLVLKGLDISYLTRHWSDAVASKK